MVIGMNTMLHGEPNIQSPANGTLHDMIKKDKQQYFNYIKRQSEDFKKYA